MDFEANAKNLSCSSLPRACDFTAEIIAAKTSLVIGMLTSLCPSLCTARMLWPVGSKLKYSKPSELRSNSLDTHFMGMTSCLCVRRALKSENWGWVNAVSKLMYVEFRSAWHMFTAANMSQTNASTFWANCMSEWTTLNIPFPQNP